MRQETVLCRNCAELCIFCHAVLFVVAGCLSPSMPPSPIHSCFTQLSFNVFHLFAEPTSHTHSPSIHQHSPRSTTVTRIHPHSPTVTHSHPQSDPIPHSSTPPQDHVPFPRRPFKSIRFDLNSPSLIKSAHIRVSAPTFDRKFDCAPRILSIIFFNPFPPRQHTEVHPFRLSLQPRTSGPAVTPWSWDTRPSKEAIFLSSRWAKKKERGQVILIVVAFLSIGFQTVQCVSDFQNKFHQCKVIWPLAFGVHVQRSEFLGAAEDCSSAWLRPHQILTDSVHILSI